VFGNVYLILVSLFFVLLEFNVKIHYKSIKWVYLYKRYKKNLKKLAEGNQYE